jgi:hypothetical protein
VNVHVNAPWLDDVVQATVVSPERRTVIAEYSPKPAPLTVSRLPGVTLVLESVRVGPTVKLAVATFGVSALSRTITVLTPRPAFGTTNVHANEPDADVVVLPRHVRPGT